MSTTLFRKGLEATAFCAFGGEQRVQFDANQAQLGVGDVQHLVGALVAWLKEHHGVELSVDNQHAYAVLVWQEKLVK